jgi:hypothetical protein
MKLHAVTATDENGNDFAALTAHPHPDAEKHVPVWVFVDGPNGWGANEGAVSLHSLKQRRLMVGKLGKRPARHRRARHPLRRGQGGCRSRSPAPARELRPRAHLPRRRRPDEGLDDERQRP